MSRFLSGLLFFGTVLAVLVGVHLYVWRRLVRDPEWPAPWNRVGTVAVIAAAVFLPAGIYLGHRFHGKAGSLAAGAAYTWFSAVFMLALFFFATDVARLVAQLATWLGGARAPVDPERRLFLARAAAGAAGLTVAGVNAFGLRSALGEVNVEEVPLKLARLPRELSGFTIVQLSDIHVGPTIGRKFIEQLVEKTNALSPDLVAITGDLVDGSVRQLRDSVEPLAKLRARHGVLFVTGNHEYYSGVGPWLQELERLGIRTLTNELVTVGDSGASFDVAGIPDYAGSWYGAGPDLDAATRDRPADRELVVLGHQPRMVERAARRNAGLLLCGHTHGGQIRPFDLAVALTQPFVVGLHRQGDTQVYVSPGTGYWGPPIRVGVPAEITKLVLAPA